MQKETFTQRWGGAEHASRNGFLLGFRVPSADHFQTQVARVLFDMGDEKTGVPHQVQTMLHRVFARLVVAALQGSARWVPLLRRIDRLTMAHCHGPIKRDILAELCDRAPHLIEYMPQCRHHIQALSRALFLSSVLHPAALRRIEDAVRAEALNSSVQ